MLNYTLTDGTSKCVGRGQCLPAAMVTDMYSLRLPVAMTTRVHALYTPTHRCTYFN